MKAKLLFDLNEYEDEQRFKACLKGEALANYIFDILHNSKKSFEYNIDQKKYATQYDLLDDIYETFWERLEQRNINLHELTE